MTKNKRKRRNSRLTAMLRSFAADILLVGLTLVVFAYFHHVRQIQYEPPVQPDPPIVEPGGEGGEDSPVNDGILYHFDVDSKEKNVEVTKDSYTVYQTDKSKTLKVTLTQANDGRNTYYVEDILISDYRCLRNAFARGKYGRSLGERTLALSIEHNAIAAINGDTYGWGKPSAVIRDGVLYRAEATADICVMYKDGTMAVVPQAKFNAEDEMAKGAWQAWSFGPSLIKSDGTPGSGFSGYLAGEHPRTAIGYIEPGHYVFVVVDGRQSGYSVGMTLDELAELMCSLGCKVAYNLDGGATSEMTFNKVTVNRPSAGGRNTSDIIYITDWEGKQ